MKIVINACYGGFGLSPKALLWLWNKGYRGNAMPVDKYYGRSVCSLKEHLEKWRAFQRGVDTKGFFMTVFSPDEKYVLCGGRGDIERNDSLLVECIEELGEKDASASLAKLSIVEIPDGVNWQISEYDGVETVEEVHRSWS